MKLGVFLPNGQNGYLLSNAAPQFEPSFQYMLDITKEAEGMGLDFILSMIKYRGFGGSTGYWDGCLDSINLASGLAARTSKIELYATVPVLGLHPAIAARQIATFNDIAKGRAGVNLVTGWNAPEYEPLGMWPGEDYYDRRYDYAAEYVEIMRALWRDGRATYKGEFFQLDDATMFPTPGRYIPIVTAGQSPRGQKYTAEYSDYNFVFADRKLLPQIVKPVQDMAKEAGRKVGTLPLYQIIAAETDEKAQARVDELVENADHEAIKNVMGSAAMDPQTGGTSKHFLDGLTADPEVGNATFMSFPVLHGSYETVAEKIISVDRDFKIPGMLMTFVDWVPDLKAFGEKILPLVREKTSVLQPA